MKEEITKAQQSAQLLYQDIREAHRSANTQNAIAEILLRDLLEKSLAIRRTLSEMEVALES